MQFSTLTFGLVAMLMAALPAISAPQSGPEFDDAEFMLPDVPSEVANMFTPPEGLKIITDTTLPQMTEGLASVLMTMVTAIGVTTTQPPSLMLPTSTGDVVPQHDHDLDNIEDMEDIEDIALPTQLVSLPVFTYSSSAATETASSVITIPTSINATTTGNGTHTHTMTMPTALANSASGLQPFLLSATTLLALGIAILAL
ncbi:uncharacterized protein LAJ45_08854 [Morchella importuna]|uniref:uncharacterized protein n=1 Tax=Morchella importuna TaxID=1174673 RepID=UPI001E8EAACC|nr:uncharacterized protein LAJ45_08854 [Morchella importuna]KAH8147055.1 hypothetical protein LAJ45_08854 [Morchella importuna]